MKSNTALYSFLNTAFLMFLLALPVLSQDEENLKDAFVEAESYFLFEEYKDALPLYQRILRAYPENFNISYKIGICYLNDIYQVDKSISYLEKAVSGISSESKTTNFRETKAPPEALYYLGNAYHANYKLEDAIEAYEKFKKVLDPMVYDISLVEQQINSCRIAEIQQKNPIYFISTNLGEEINDRFEEINPVISGDETTLAFTRKLQFYDAVFVSKSVNGKWSEPVNLTADFGVDGNSYTTGLSYDGKEIFIYRSDNFDGNLYVSHFNDGKWSKLDKLNGNINTKYWESHASLSKDSKTLYFTSNREGGYGGLDIYRSQRSKADDWGPAVNLGPVINTKYNEDTPFITDDANTLYFSSMGHYNMGGYDIFYSTRLQNGQWAKPVNAGFPLNTTNNDMFFVPLRDGAYAYYSKYIPETSIGMADIYKLEVFTELHPRKFILNGITRVDGQVSPSFSQFTATLIDPKTGKVIDQTRLNPDGTYTLNVLSGQSDLQIKGQGINETTERLTIPVDNASDVIAHSSLITASQAPVDVRESEQLPPQEPAVGPEMIISVQSYNVTTDESIPIRLDLERDTKLKVARIVDGSVTGIENFNINRRRFIYMLTPEPGMNTLLFTLTNTKGDSTVSEVVIIYTPPAEELPSLATAENVVLSDSNRYQGLISLAQDSIADFLNRTDLRNMDFKSIADLYEYLLQNSEANGFSDKDVNDLVLQFLSQKDLNIFYDELKNNSGDSLSKALVILDPGKNSVYTSDALVDYLYGKSDSSIYSLEELRDALYRIAAINRDPRELLILLESYSTGDLQNFLITTKQNSESFNNTKSVADHIMEGAINNAFPVVELESMLKLAATDLNIDFLSQSLIFISSDNLKQTVLDLDFEQDNIRNSREMISSLLETSENRNYSRRELFDNIEKVRRDPYFFVDMFRKMLADKAAGSLKEFLQEIDIRGLEINTYEELLSYLLVQSQFRDYNREMVYQLLIDIINPRNVKEFIELLKKYADSRIDRAIDATDNNQFSTPLEAMQYLLSVAGEFNYTERDLLRVLLKMVLSKGPLSDTDTARKGWLSYLDKPAFITSIIVVNAVIILLLILFFLRKKKKNE
jgi:tetratricopeptide (TPR) repeat protein